jgi:hypothetical protein
MLALTMKSSSAEKPRLSLMAMLNRPPCGTHKQSIPTAEALFREQDELCHGLFGMLKRGENLFTNLRRAHCPRSLAILLPSGMQESFVAKQSFQRSSEQTGLKDVPKLRFPGWMRSVSISQGMEQGDTALMKGADAFCLCDCPV